LEYKLAKKENEARRRKIQELVEPVLNGLGFSLVELVIAEHKGSAQVRAVIYKKRGAGGLENSGLTIEDCSRAHHAIMPRLELSFGPSELHVEVSSPGAERLFKEGAEMKHFCGDFVKCWVRGAADWKCGILEGVDESGLRIKTPDGIESFKWASLAKAKLDNINIKAGM